MPFLPPNQQRQSTEGIAAGYQQLKSGKTEKLKSKKTGYAQKYR